MSWLSQYGAGTSAVFEILYREVGGIVDQLAAYVNSLLSNYVKNLKVGLHPSEYAWLKKSIVSQLELSAHNMVREAVTDLSKHRFKQTRVMQPREFLRREGRL